MLSLAVCSSASISFSKVDKTLRFEERLFNPLKIMRRELYSESEVSDLIFCYFFIKKKVKRIRVICSEAEDYDKKEIIFEQSEKKKYITYLSVAKIWA
jgi:hypothetical protein